jgi:hypothetical protein
MVESSPNIERCKIVSSSDNSYSERGITTLNVVLDASLVQSNVSDGTCHCNVR